MPDNPDRPFDHDTLKLRAVFVAESDKDQTSRSGITRALGLDALKMPVVFVPEGGKPPGYPYVRFGRSLFRPDEGAEGQRIFTSSSSSSSAARSPEADQEDSAPAPTLPLTRYRFGGALTGRLPPTPRPSPAVAAGQGDPTRTAIAVWRRLNDANRAATAQYAKRMRERRQP